MRKSVTGLSFASEPYFTILARALMVACAATLVQTSHSSCNKGQATAVARPIEVPCQVSKTCAPFKIEHSLLFSSQQVYPQIHLTQLSLLFL